MISKLRIFTILIGAACLEVGCSSPAAPASTQAEAAPVRVATLAEAPSAETIRLTGTLSSWREATISAEAADRIVDWPLHLGDRVAQGSRLAGLDDRLISAQVAEAAGQARQARAEVARLSAEYARVSEETLAEVRSAESGLAEARANQTKTDSFTRAQELRQAEAGLAQASADENFAAKELKRYERLVQSGAASQQNLDQVRAAYDVAHQKRISAEEAVSLAKEGARAEDRAAAKAKVESASAGLQAARTRPARLAAIRAQIEAAAGQAASAEAAERRARVEQGKHQVFAPFSGRVLKLNSELGEMASPGAPLLTLGETDRLKLKFSLPDEARLALKTLRISFTIADLPGKTYEANLESKGFLADSRTRNFAMEGVVANPGEVLLPGMTAIVQLPLPSKTPGVKIPIEAIVEDGGAPTVWIVEGGKVQTRRVFLQSRTGAFAIATEGVRPGDVVALNPKDLYDGERVQVEAPR